MQHKAATTWASLPPPNVLRCQTQCCCAARVWASSAYSTLEKGAKASCDSGRAGCCNARGKALQDAVVEQQTVVDSSFVGHGSAAAALSAAACRASVSRARLPFCGRGGHPMRCRRAVCYGGVCCTQRERAYYGKSSCWSGQLATIMRQCCWPPPCQSILRHSVLSLFHALRWPVLPLGLLCNLVAACRRFSQAAQAFPCAVLVAKFCLQHRGAHGRFWVVPAQLCQWRECFLPCQEFRAQLVQDMLPVVRPMCQSGDVSRCAWR